MDARWKVYVQDRRFDDNQISNVYLKLKYETVGRFSFDFRPMDGDESYMVTNNTLRIFWGDLHKLDGVIQRVDWDATQWCYHIYGADIRGLLLERVNTEPATVHSYTSDIQTHVMFQGCDFPTNVWTGSGENIGKYTFKYHIGIQNTIRIMTPTIRWENYIERGTVYEYDDGRIYDATKDWTGDFWKGGYCRFVTGGCKNNIYNVYANTDNDVYLAGVNIVENGGFDSPTLYPWGFYYFNGGDVTATATWNVDYSVFSGGTSSLRLDFFSDAYMPGYGYIEAYVPLNGPASGRLSFGYRTNSGYNVHAYVGYANPDAPMFNTIEVWNTSGTTINPSYPAFDVADVELTVASGAYLILYGECQGGNIDKTFHFDNIQFIINPGTGFPTCVKVGDIYELVTDRYVEVLPPTLAPATLEKDNHIIRYNLVDDQSEHTTSMTVRGTG